MCLEVVISSILHIQISSVSFICEGRNTSSVRVWNRNISVMLYVLICFLFVLQTNGDQVTTVTKGNQRHWRSNNKAQIRDSWGKLRAGALNCSSTSSPVNAECRKWTCGGTCINCVNIEVTDSVSSSAELTITVFPSKSVLILQKFMTKVKWPFRCWHLADKFDQWRHHKSSPALPACCLSNAGVFS